MPLNTQRPVQRRNRGVRIARRPQRIAPLPLSPALIALLARLEGRPGTPPLSDLADWLARSPIGVADLAPYVNFDHRRYTRNLVCATEHWQMLLLCWRRGQHSPIHDHNGSVCTFKVLQGKALELLYELTPTGRARYTSSHELPSTGVSAQADADIHRVVALDELVTLHIYSPPLLNMQTYEET